MKKLEKGLKELNIEIKGTTIENIIKAIKKSNQIMLYSCIFLILIYSKFPYYIIYE